MQSLRGADSPVGGDGTLAGRPARGKLSERTAPFPEGHLVECVRAAEVGADDPLTRSHGPQGKRQRPHSPAGALEDGAGRGL